MRWKWEFLIFFLMAMLIALVLYAINSPLQGLHSIRQADTLFQAYSFCYEHSSFFKPRILDRGLTSGISVGELPVFSFLVSLPCQLGGEWNEWWPRVFSMILGFLCCWQWGSNLRERTPSWKQVGGMKTFLILSLFSTFSMTHLMIPIPDACALLLVGLACRLRWQKNSILTGILFTLGFLIRPYLFPLIGLLSNRRSMGYSCAFSVVGYIIWYKVWVPYASEVSYFAVNMDLLFGEGLQDGVLALFERLLRNHFQFIMIFPWIMALQKNDFHVKKWSFWGLASCLLVLLVKSQHLSSHGYYLAAAFIYFSFAMFQSLANVSGKLISAYLILFLVISILNTQHLFRNRYGDYQQNLRAQIPDRLIASELLAASFTADEEKNPTDLYLLKIPGWALSSKDWKGQCPRGASLVILREASHVQIKSCSQATAH
jgi:hypothetical protein